MVAEEDIVAAVADIAVVGAVGAEVADTAVAADHIAALELEADKQAVVERLGVADTAVERLDQRMAELELGVALLDRLVRPGSQIESEALFGRLLPLAYRILLERFLCNLGS